MDSVAIAQLAQPTSRPLSAVLRERIDGDAELRRLRGELKNWLMRGLGAFDIDGRRIAARRLRELAPGVPRLIQVAGYTVEKVAAAYATDPRTAHLQDAWAAIWARRIEGRLAMLLARVFDQLRGGEIVATGRLAANPLAPIVVPPELWDARHGSRPPRRRHPAQRRPRLRRRGGLVAGTASAATRRPPGASS